MRICLVYDNSLSRYLIKEQVKGQPLLVSIKELTCRQKIYLACRLGMEMEFHLNLLSFQYSQISFGLNFSVYIYKTHPSIGLSKNFFSSFDIQDIFQLLLR